MKRLNKIAKRMTKKANDNFYLFYSLYRDELKRLQRKLEEEYDWLDQFDNDNEFEIEDGEKFLNDRQYQPIIKYLAANGYDLIRGSVDYDESVMTAALGYTLRNITKEQWEEWNMEPFEGNW